MAFGKIHIAAGLLAAALTLGGGAAVVRAAAPGATPGATPGTTPKVAGCADVQAKLAQNLGIGVDKLQAAEKATANQLIDERLAAGKITPDQAQKAHDKVNASTNFCPRLAVDRARQGRAAAIGKVERVELQAVAQKFGMSEQDLVKALRDGNSLATLAQQHNVSRDDLKATMRGALKTQLNQAVANKKIDQAREDKALATFDANADKLIDRQWGRGKNR